MKLRGKISGRHFLKIWLFCLLIFTAIPGMQCMASNLKSYKRITEDTSVKIGSVKFSTKNGVIYATSGGKKKVLVRGCVSGGLTDGKVLYYSTGKSPRNAANNGSMEYRNRKVYKYTISSAKKKVIYKRAAYGSALTPFACDGIYLYLGGSSQYLYGFWNMTVLNLKTQKSRFISKEASFIQPVKGRLLVSATAFPHGGPLYLMNRDGSKVKYITKENVSEVKIKGNYIYYTEMKYTWESRRCRCNLDGSNPKALEKWSGGVV